jgi:hypothetical protein
MANEHEIIGRLGTHKRHPERLCLMHPNGEPSNWYGHGVTRAEIAASLADAGMILRDDDTVVRAAV